VSPITMQSLRRRKVQKLIAAAGAVCIAGLLGLIWRAGVDCPVLAAQSKQECNRCCEGKGYDEYFLEDCKLKCFRNPNHCVDGKTTSKPPREPKPTQPSQSKPRSEFRWPQPVNLTPGSEWEAAAQILSLNGITPQNPNAAAALRAVEAVLVEFVRQNPSGGRLPTAKLEEIIRRYR
jgi:hypothetical protein